jgi:hypothetical protein
VAALGARAQLGRSTPVALLALVGQLRAVPLTEFGELRAEADQVAFVRGALAGVLAVVGAVSPAGHSSQKAWMWTARRARSAASRFGAIQTLLATPEDRRDLTLDDEMLGDVAADPHRRAGARRRPPPGGRNHLRALLPDLTTFSGAERALLHDWLDCIINSTSHQHDTTETTPSEQG